MHVAVVGAGVMGAATARWLARDGHDVAVFEQFAFGHARGSSHGESRVFRFSYPDPKYVSMAMEALPLWRELEEETGEALLRTTGGLDAGVGLQDHVDALHACGRDFEILDADAAVARFPWLGGLPGPVLYQGDGAVIAADRSVRALLQSAGAHGAALHERAKVAALRETGTGVVVESAVGSVEVDVAVVTAGGWVNELVGPLGIELPARPTRETVAYFDHAGPPVTTFVEWGTPTMYALWSSPGVIKAGEHQAGPPTDPNETADPDGTSVRRLETWVTERFPGVNPKPRRAESCIYTNMPDNGFVLERHRDIVVGSPCSGHGFKFSVLIGKRLAELAVDPVRA